MRRFFENHADYGFANYHNCVTIRSKSFDMSEVAETGLKYADFLGVDIFGNGDILANFQASGNTFFEAIG